MCDMPPGTAKYLVVQEIRITSLAFRVNRKLNVGTARYSTDKSVTNPVFAYKVTTPREIPRGGGGPTIRGLNLAQGHKH
jgi:hypothetical protein